MPPRPKKREALSNAFLDALRFIGLVLSDKGAPYETHVYLHDGYATAFNGIIAAGCKIDQVLTAAPNNSILIEALSKCGQNLSITQFDNNRISIKSDKFKAIIPCLDSTTFQTTMPDAPIAIIDDRLKVACDAVEVLASTEADNALQASILLHNGSAIATNRAVIFEYWHGIDLPPNLSIPKTFVKALIKTPKKLTQFGYSQSSVTFWFEDGSWLRTQLYAETWPDIGAILNNPCNPQAVPADFFKGLEAVAPFSPDGLVHFSENLLLSHPSQDVGASYEVAELPAGPIFSAKQLALLKGHAETIDFAAKGASGTYLAFFGPNIRGAIAGREPRPVYKAIEAKPLTDEQRKQLDDEIPF